MPCQEIKLDGEEFLIMKEDDVLAVIEGHTQKKLAAIKGKIRSGEKVVTDGQLRVVPGKPVSIVGRRGNAR